MEKGKTVGKKSTNMKNRKTVSKKDDNTSTINPHIDKNVPTKCTDNFCKKYVAKQTKNAEKLIKDMINHIKQG